MKIVAVNLILVFILFQYLTFLFGATHIPSINSKRSINHNFQLINLNLLFESVQALIILYGIRIY